MDESVWVTFLNARLAEDAAGADELHNELDCNFDELRFFGDCSCGYKARALREVEAKRAILAEHTPMEGFDGARLDGQICQTCSDLDRDGGRDGEPWPCATVRHLAGIWVGHPDYPKEP